MNAKAWKVGLVGVGRGSGYGRLFADDPRCAVTAVCDPSADALARFQSELELDDAQCFDDYARFIETDLDIVFIGSPMPAHAEQVVAALECGVAVLSEVTMASNVEGCRRILETARRTGVTYMLAENCCYWHFVREWRDIVNAGRIGDVLYAECEYLHPLRDAIIDPETGRKRWRADRAPLHYCSHSLGPILEITGDRITHAMGVGLGNRLLPQAMPGGIDIQAAMFKTKRGAILKLLRSSIIPRKPHLHFYRLIGTKGFLESSQRSIQGTGLFYAEDEMDEARDLPCPRSDPALPESAHKGGHGTAEYTLLQEFLSALADGRAPALDAERAVDLCLPGLIAHESALRGGEWMEIPEL